MNSPLWSPGQDRVDRASLVRFMRFVREESGNADLNSYAPLYRFSVEQPAQFWTLLWDFVGIRASGVRQPVLVDGAGMGESRWFPDVSLNFAQNLLRFDDERVAIRCFQDGTELAALTYSELQLKVAALAAALRASGVGIDDCVAAALPNVPDKLVTMLASASIGARWFACPAQGGPERRAALLDAVAPKVLFVTADAAIDGSTRARVPLIIEVPSVSAEAHAAGTTQLPGAVALDSFVAGFAGAEADYTPVAFDHPLYLTCARSAGSEDEIVVHGTGGTLIQHLKELLLHLDLKREDKVFFHADSDAMAWYWLASTLAIGSTLLLHAGEELPADGPKLWDLVDECGITVLGVHSHWLDAAARAGVKPTESHRLLTLKTILSAGGPVSSETCAFVYRDIKARVLLSGISTGGDTLACFALGAPVLPVWPGEVGCRGLGMKVEVLDASGESCVGTIGDLACSAAFPSMPLGFVDDPDRRRFDAAYFSRHAGRWCSGERAMITARESLVIDPGTA